MGETKVLRIKPMEKIDNNKDYNIKIKLYTCTSKFEAKKLLTINLKLNLTS